MLQRKHKVRNTANIFGIKIMKENSTNFMRELI
jgi:hypothetical protein